MKEAFVINVSVSIGDTNIAPSTSVRNSSVEFDQKLTISKKGQPLL